MKTFKYIFLSIIACMAMSIHAAEDTLTFVKTDGSTETFSTAGLTITYDDFAHIVVTNDETSAMIDLADVDYMCFGGDVQPHITGDVNGDTLVNIADLNAVINVILGGQAIPLADVNGDGNVNISDINAIVNIILIQ